jgi:hypothetical protein
MYFAQEKSLKAFLFMKKIIKCTSAASAEVQTRM